ncbi:MAG: hypothetical protein ABR956_14330 [Terracidiphilus sp.]|jgi:hypothetical protein
MKKSLILGSILSFALASAGSAQGAAAPAEDHGNYTQAQLKQMAHEAHTPQQYKELASFYGNQQKSYLEKAGEEKQEWIRRSQITTSIYAKYPRPADSARYLYEYYAAKASEAGSLSAKYSQLAEPTGAAMQQHM